jgi:hypothetical protein
MLRHRHRSDAVRIARRMPGIQVSQGDVRHLTFDDCSVRTCINLPFGKRYTVRQDMKEWLRTALEMAR